MKWNYSKIKKSKKMLLFLGKDVREDVNNPTLTRPTVSYLKIINLIFPSFITWKIKKSKLQVEMLKSPGSWKDLEDETFRWILDILFLFMKWKLRICLIQCFMFVQHRKSYLGHWYLKLKILIRTYLLFLFLTHLFLFSIHVSELYPIRDQENKQLNTEKTAEALDLYRHFYKVCCPHFKGIGVF